MSPYEAIMLICFGASWPVSISKSIRTRQVQGKSALFMSLVAIGYVSGTIHKCIYRPDWIVVLYIFNLMMVLTDLSLYYALRNKPAR